MKVELEILKRFPKNTTVSLIVILSIGLIMRMHFIPWDLPSPAPDSFVFMLEGIQYSIGDIEQFNNRFLWPFFISVFFIFFNFDDYLGYINIMRVLSVCISVASVMIVYLIANSFVRKKWALAAAFLFSIEPNIIQNSTWAIREPLFIFFGLLAFYFIIHKNERLVPLAFIMAGLSFDTRINGIAVFFTIFCVCFLKFKNKSKLVKNLGLGTFLFLIVSLPHIFFAVDEGKLPFIHNIQDFETLLTQEKAATSTFSLDENPTTLNLLKNMIFREIIHFGRIMIPFLIILAPIGFLYSVRKLDFPRKSLFVSIIFSLLVAFPIYILSAEFRNLLFITPMLCILSAVGIQKIKNKIDSNLVMLSILALLVISSVVFLNVEMKIDKELEMEKNRFGRYVVTNFSGKVMGDLYNNITFNVQNAKIGQDEEDDNIYNDKIGVVVSEWPLDSEAKLKEYVKNRNIDYLIIDDTFDKRYPIFEEIFTNSERFPYLERQFDSQTRDYSKINVKIFKIKL